MGNSSGLIVTDVVQCWIKDGEVFWIDDLLHLEGPRVVTGESGVVEVVLAQHHTHLVVQGAVRRQFNVSSMQSRNTESHKTAVLFPKKTNITTFPL